MFFLEAVNVINVKIGNDSVMFFKIRFQVGNEEEATYVEHEEVKEKYPNLLLDFYESKLKFK